ncbi:T-box transcription factor TBX18-like [Sinocyclocheilus grahami]|uniref:T-box transcription factor TBX18-like n=1 Tax=Sinocyclocheilus grahami TaxID=75366 RepID=UPI0007ACC245|nr:PREDICTED: T-box transcription factor TBX18-like [Sinocyclocheilus grahami]
MTEKRRSPCTMSLKAHAFSVEALIGTEKKRKLEEDNENCFEEENEGSNLTESPQPRPGRTCPSTRSCETDCASDESPESEDVLLDSPQPASQGSQVLVQSATSSGEETRVDLQGSDLWKRFHEIGTEMIITKAGRRMFPAMRVKIAGLDPHQQYYIAMDIVPVDNKRYRYVYHSSKWMITRLKIDRNPFAKGFRDSGRNRMGLEALVESYAFWRPSLRTLTFEDIPGITKQGAAGSHGVVGSSTHAHLLSSSSCSSPTFHLGSGAGPVCDYSTCSRTSHPLHRYAPPLSADSYSRLASPAADAFSTTRSSTYVSGTEGEAFSCTQTGLPIQIHSMPSTTSQLQYLMPSHTHNAFSTNQSTQGSYNGFRLHSPYGLYGYNFSTSPRLATSPEKTAATQSSFLGSSPSGTLTDRQVLSTVDSLHMLSSSQQNIFDSRTLGLTSSTSQVTAHMA